MRGKKKMGSESEKERGGKRGKKVEQVGEKTARQRRARGNRLGGSPATRKRCWRGWQPNPIFRLPSPLSNWSASLNITLTLAIEKKIKACWCFPRSSMASYRKLNY